VLQHGRVHRRLVADDLHSHHLGHTDCPLRRPRGGARLMVSAPRAGPTFSGLNHAGYLLRQERPRPSRRLHRPRLLTVSGPIRLDAETPLRERFSQPRRPSRTRRRKMRPMRSLLIVIHRYSQPSLKPHSSNGRRPRRGRGSGGSDRRLVVEPAIIAGRPEALVQGLRATVVTGRLPDQPGRAVLAAALQAAATSASATPVPRAAAATNRSFITPTRAATSARDSSPPHTSGPTGCGEPLDISLAGQVDATAGRRCTSG
jgi:hypothetical protein